MRVCVREDGRDQMVCMRIMCMSGYERVYKKNITRR